MDGEFDLQRFVTAQDGVMANVRAELAAGHKRSHWMWFVFPQVAGLGFSAMAQRYAISSVAEARAYLAHPVLGPRLRECTELVLGVEGRDARAIFGSPDDLKFRSSMTLFAHEGAEPCRLALDKFFAGESDVRTLSIVRNRDS
ncbi:MAG TPA: DUF1810 domain-containing protein [Rhizomicrobium sp.]|nr:DUF1810 domain-containing protein [Rhizomicrobium sp.]